MVPNVTLTASLIQKVMNRELRLYCVVLSIYNKLRANALGYDLANLASDKALWGQT